LKIIIHSLKFLNFLKVLKISFVFILFLIFFLNNFLYSLEKRKYAQDQKNMKDILILTKNGNVLNPLEYLKKNVFEPESEIAKNNSKNEENQVFISSATPVTISVDYEQQYQKALKNFNEGNYKDALEIFSSLLPVYPSKRNIIYYLNKSQEVILQNSEDIKYRTLKEIINYDLVVAKSCFGNKEYIKAYDFYEKIMLLDTSKKLFQEIADIDAIMKNILDKREIFSIEEYHYAKSYFLFKDGKMDKCIDEWEKIIELNLNRIEIKDYLILFKDKNYKNKFDLRKVNLFLNEAIKLYNTRKYEKASQYFYKVLLISDDEIAKLYLKECKLRMEQMTKKQEMVYIDVLKEEEDKKNKNDEKKYRETLQGILSKQKGLKDFVNEIKNSENSNNFKDGNLDPAVKKTIDILYKKGLNYYYLGDIESAKKSWEKILEYDPKNKKTLKRLKKIRD
jgi:tetratricopeptide (TPR) repeat protein